MSSSQDIVRIQSELLNLQEIVDSVISPECGAVSTFIGTTRDHFDDKKVIKLEYEAYEPMALREMKKICEKIRESWKVGNVAISHRLGEVPVKEASVIIAIASAHRSESLEAVKFAIDTLKATVPIWKKEIYEDSAPQWKENAECTWSSAAARSQSVVDREIIVDPSLVQIKADNDELKRRIESFITRKREQMNNVNVQEFCYHSERNDDDTPSCARVDAILIRRKDSKSHVKVHRVQNQCGPQTMDPSLLRKPAVNDQMSEEPDNSIAERLSEVETTLAIDKPIPRDIYERLKNIEDKLAFLESVSPEYKDFLQITCSKETSRPIATNYVRKRTYSSAELDSKITQLEEKFSKRVN